MIYFVRGSFVPEEDASVSVLDRGFLFGDSVYETLRAHQGRILFFRDHLKRLERSAASLEIELGDEPRRLLAILRELLRRNRLDDARMRIVVTRGTGLAHDRADFVPSWCVLVEPYSALPEEAYERGVSAVLVHVARHSAASLDPEIKSSNLLNNILARREAMKAGAAEGILLSPAGFLAEGAHSNLFWATREGKLRTPSRRVGILAGITRQKLMECAARMGQPVEEVEAREEELDGAEEIFLSSTSWEALSVTRWNGRGVGDGRWGRWARDLRARLRTLYDDPDETA